MSNVIPMNEHFYKLVRAIPFENRREGLETKCEVIQNSGVGVPNISELWGGGVEMDIPQIPQYGDAGTDF